MDNQLSKGCYRTLWAQLVSLLPQIHDLILFFAVNNVKRNEIVSIVLEKQIQFLFLGIFKGIIEFCGNISQRINTSSSIFKPNKLTTTRLKNNSSQRITLFLVYYWFLTCCLANVPARLALEKADGLMVGIKPKRTRWATSISSVAQADGPGQIEEKESEIGP